MARNEEFWSVIYEKPFLESSADDSDARADRDEAWKYLEALEADGRLTQLDLLRISALLDAVHSIGLINGKS